MLPGDLHSKRKIRNKGALRYSTREYANPFFAERKSSNFKINAQQLPLYVKLTSLFVLAVAVAAIWVLFYSPYFRITVVEISGQGRVPVSAVEKIAQELINRSVLVILPQKNLFFFDKGDLEKVLKDKYSFDNLHIDKKLPHTLTINYEEKKHSFIWNEDDKFYYIDEGGAVISEVDPLEVQEKDYPLINNQSDSKITGDAIAIDKLYLSYIADLFSRFREYKTTHEDPVSKEKNEVSLDEIFKIQKFVIDNEANTVKLVLTEGPMVYFNIQEDAGRQINKLIIIKNEKIKEDFHKKTYIDLRIGDSVYYR
ncbi:hypothetical protein A2303_06230 [Candidatus Falkowbacteria bacterium RIFOXYB2_FULL_47_14]|uniref:POTRA domain-containing protein n=1 Tax=Candidatus Falkowbacteria bacterium RIFOXYA2_FULL_47_19 TaxID=1797994 RepID=A0A1F5SMN4_9BACT|nr:MAG: hypothetical protein A2227_05165 [Candidatus Falkowbacteria bacterium RIFOXYA2_FULL_47_19]OGF35123.1 MAG: hypothetical protein A2468_04015 [Candidatus Falkowbacteria bacterium RIFOXYC2_FULL_46_15]OGF43159.1 MAG: hypothetical protein A2303_06230 [Candidatus Falkowbacteria bacterium RIFOXYB2_FULL_47_14]